MTGQAFYDYCLAVIKRPDKSTEIYQAMADVIMDMRLRFYARDYEKFSTELAISSIGDFSVALPSDFGHNIGKVSVRDSASDQSYPPTDKISIDTFNKLYAQRNNTAVGNRLTGPPNHFCIFGGNLLIGPPVDKTTYKFKMTYTQEDAPTIDASTTLVPFTDKYRKTVRYGVVKEVYLILENYQEADAWSTLFEQDLAKIVNNDNANRRDDEPIYYNGV